MNVAPAVTACSWEGFKFVVNTHDSPLMSLLQRVDPNIIMFTSSRPTRGNSKTVTEKVIVVI